MNKTAIKNFAIWARVQLIEAAKQKAYEYGVTGDAEQSAAAVQAVAADGRPLTQTERAQRNALLERIRVSGYEQVMEEAAYTWFNRFIALRFMEVNGYLPSKVRVFTDESGAFRPEILKQAVTVELDGLDRALVLELLDRQDNETLYKYLLITQCNALSAGLPYMFERIANWTELLFPGKLLKPDSVIGQMIESIPESDWTDAVQIIGWLYQYYNSELKDETFALLKKNVKITKERIPAATQLFTPDWIVRYMVENSLGRIAVASQQFADGSESERIEKEKAYAEKMGWRYYLPEAEQTPEVRKQLSAISDQLSADPTTLRVLDPCMGSGHILVYAFDVLMQMYASAGWGERDAARSILENNLYGLDIDDRAGQLAYFAVMMKARRYNRRILNGEVKPNVFAIRDSNWMTDGFIDYAAGRDARLKADLVLLRKTFKDAKEFGSILNVPNMDFPALYERIDIIGRSYLENLTEAAYQTEAKEQLLPLVRQAEIMAQKYDAVVTNPPYMGASGMSAKLSEFVKTNYPDSKSDLFAVFIERWNEMTKTDGYNCMVTMQSWMFLSSFEKMRQKLLAGYTITNLMHMDNMVMHIAFGTAVTVFKNRSIEGFKGTYNQVTFKDVIDDGDERPKEFPVKGNRYAEVSASNFSKIPGSPVAYWVSEAFFNTFAFPSIQSFCAQKTRISTGDNDRFMRKWYEISYIKMLYPNKWVPCPKGGDYRKWYGNIDLVLNWENDGFELKSFPRAMLGDKYYFFKPGITWTVISSTKTGFRIVPEGCICDHKGPLIYIQDKSKRYLLMGLLNSCYSEELLRITAPTIGFEWGAIAKTPWIDCNNKSEAINARVESCIQHSKQDWDSFETSWDFKKHPLV